jgi:chromate reductase, NAD(P)H dehydrogenase (quinone)
MILLLTQSSKTGANYKIAEDCKTLIENFGKTAAIKNFNDEIDIQEYESFIMIVPEWNRSIPFTLKSLIDNSGWPSAFNNKDVYLIGTSGSIGGNMLGLSHLTDILDYIGAHVRAPKIYIEHIQSFDRESKSAKTISELILKITQKACLTS